MAFILDDENPTISWPVRVEVGQSGGTYRRMTFEAEFKVIGNDELQEMFSVNEEDENKTDFDWASEVIVGWSGIQDKDGAEVPFTKAGLKQLINKPAVGKAIADAFMDCRQKARSKN